MWDISKQGEDVQGWFKDPKAGAAFIHDVKSLDDVVIPDGWHLVSFENGRVHLRPTR